LDSVDPDIDNDGICNLGGPLPDGTPGTPSGGCRPGASGKDNCPAVYNPNQADLDGNGTGFACEDELLIKVGPKEIDWSRHIKLPPNPEIIQIIILPNQSVFGRNWIPENLFVEIKVQLEIDTPMRIVDDQGFVVAQAQFGKDKLLRFHPKADFFYRSSSSNAKVDSKGLKTIEPYQGRQYYLQIFPTTKEDAERTYKISIKGSTKIEEQIK
jgi:hypothetical protein